MAPTFIAFCIAFLVPFIMGLYLSLCEFRTVSDAQFVGLENYIKAFGENNDFLNWGLYLCAKGVKCR